MVGWGSSPCFGWAGAHALNATVFGADCSVSGLKILVDDELLPQLLEWVMFSSTLESDMEFHTFWIHVLQCCDRA